MVRTTAPARPFELDEEERGVHTDTHPMLCRKARSRALANQPGSSPNALSGVAGALGASNHQVKLWEVPMKIISFAASVLIGVAALVT